MPAGERRAARLALCAALVVAPLAGCGHGTRAAFVLDRSPRVADDEGVVTAVDLSSITLDGTRTYKVDDALVSFSDINLSTVPLLFTEHQYVQVGADGHTARWIGAVARPLTTTPPKVVYAGTVRRAAHGQLVFDNGTVFTVAPSVKLTGLAGQRVVVGVRPDQRAVTEVAPQ